MRNYGIYLCYPPTVDLRKEGLGRYLAAFIKGSEHLDDVKFSILCPSWSQDDLNSLFESEGVPLDKVSINSPQTQPIILRINNRIQKFRKKKVSKGRIAKVLERIKKIPIFYINRIEERVAQSYSFKNLLPILFDVFVVVALGIVLTPFVALAILFSYRSKLFKFKSAINTFVTIKNKVLLIFNNPKDQGFVLRLYRLMLQAETERMHKLIQEVEPVLAWYSPTAFWASFSKIDAPKLMCVPDVVLTRFPSGFSQIGGDRVLSTFIDIQQTIMRNEYFVTYSEDVKYRTLNEHFNIEPEQVYVVQHAPNRLDNWLEVSNFPDNAASANFYAKKLLLVALSKQKDPYVKGLGKDFKFIFYASQFRPNKNVMNLLKSYDYLLKNNFITHKLILTGSPEQSKEVSDFINQRNLNCDVLLMSGLTVQELAACYKLSDLAVNPTLSEGGCPFTFTEALSVGTPVVMGRIGVTEEVLTDPKLQEMTFFDPYDWKSIADKIEWALNNLDPLREIQLQTYEKLMKRTWEDVVTEHITAMDEIAEKFHSTQGELIEQH
jgi:glycosyltransferase involved in cell wall biosynthesis